MAMLMETRTSDELLLSEEDFPDGWRGMAHPDDYQVVSTPIRPTLFVHHRPHHNRLIFRTSFKVGEASYVSASFVVDTGAPSSIYLGKPLRAVLQHHNRILTDDTENEYVLINEIGKRGVESTSIPHQPANVIGLPFIEKLQLVFTAEGPVFNITPAYF